ncbi:MAG: CPBP family intramembrane glutamic endopeptidase [Chloroflexota bacterium]
MQTLRVWFRDHPLLAFFALSFALTWAIMVPLTLASRGIGNFPDSIPLLLLMSYGPTLAALIVTGVVAGRGGIRALLSRLLIWRVGLQWYLAAIFLNAGIILGAYGLFVVSGGAAQPLPALGPLFAVDVLLTFVVVALVNGEEIGWRGFALPRLQGRWSALVATLILGTIQAVFHLPIFFNEGPSSAGGQNGMPFAGFWLSTIAAALLLTWIYNNTHGSLLLAILFHASMNAWSSVLPFPTDGPFFWMLVGVQSVVALVVLAVYGPTRLSRRPVEEMPYVKQGAPAGLADFDERREPTDLAA